LKEKLAELKSNKAGDLGKAIKEEKKNSKRQLELVKKEK